MRRADSTLWSLLFAILACVSIAQYSAMLGKANLFGDFRAFYCAAKVTAEHRSPYELQPMQQCQGIVPPTPAPIPGYAIAALIPLAQLPFNTAAIVWVIVMLGCIWLSVRFLIPLTGFQLPFIIASLLLPLVTMSIASGELVPVAVLALVAAAYYLRKRNISVAAGFIALSFIEPHVAVPAFIALLALVPKIRVPLCIAVVALAALSLAVLGVHENVAYFSSVLPAHAASELDAHFQYSLPTILHGLGVSDSASVTIGNVFFLLTIVAGLVCAKRLSAFYDDAAFVVLIPPAIALIGEPFIHLVQMPVAIPAVLLLASRAMGLRGVLLPALILLAIPWQAGSAVYEIWIAGLVIAFYLAYAYAGTRAAAASIAGAVAIALLLALSAQYTPASHVHPPKNLPAAAMRNSAEQAWASYVTTSDFASPARWIQRIPTWAGLILLVTAVAASSRTAGKARSTPRRARNRRWGFPPARLKP